MVRKWTDYFDSTAIVVVIISVVVQAVYLFEIAGGEAFGIPIIDAAEYHSAAMRFAQGKPLAFGAFWQPPLFPLLLGCLYWTAGVSIALAKVGLALLGTGSCLLLWRLGATLFSRRVGLVAGVTLALYGPFLFFSTELLPAGLGVFLSLLALVLWIECLKNPKWYGWAVLGLTIGAAILAVPNAGVLGLLVVGGLVVSAVRHHSRRSIGYALAVLLGCCVVIAPVTIRNFQVSGSVVLVSSNGGINFFIGNNPDRDRTVAIRPGEYWTRLGRAGFGQASLSRAEQDDYFWKRGLAYVVDDPAGFLAGLGRKSLRFLNAREIPRNIDVYVASHDATLLRALLWRVGSFAFPAGLVIPLGIVGALVTRRWPADSRWQRSGRGALWAFALSYAASVILFFVTARYRLPAMPILILFASAFVVRAAETLRRTAKKRRFPRRGVTIATALAAVTLVVNLPLAAPTDHVNFEAERAMCLGQAHAAAGALDQAEDRLRVALALEPEYADALGKLANIMARRNELHAAEALARQSLLLDQHSLDARWILGDVLHRQQRLAEAEQLYRETLEMDPHCGEAHMGLAEVLLQSGKAGEAIEHYRAAYASGHLSERVLRRLPELLVARGDYEEGISWYRQALDRGALDTASLNALAWLLATCPRVELRDCDEAIVLAERLCRETDYAHPVALDTLAAAYAECGRLDQAVFFSTRAIELARSRKDKEAVDTFAGRLRRYQERQTTNGKTEGRISKKQNGGK